MRFRFLFFSFFFPHFRFLLRKKIFPRASRSLFPKYNNHFAMKNYYYAYGWRYILMCEKNKCTCRVSGMFMNECRAHKFIIINANHDELQAIAWTNVHARHTYVRGTTSDTTSKRKTVSEIQLFHYKKKGGGGWITRRSTSALSSALCLHSWEVSRRIAECGSLFAIKARGEVCRSQHKSNSKAMPQAYTFWKRAEHRFWYV